VIAPNNRHDDDDEFQYEMLEMTMASLMEKSALMMGSW
jgi:hypothetical protein